MTDYTKQLVEQSRELHQWPEEGWTEFWTTNYIVNKLPRPQHGNYPNGLHIFDDPKEYDPFGRKAGRSDDEEPDGM